MSELAEYSCSLARDAIRARGDDKQWYDGFYLTQGQGHHSNKCSATLHDYKTGVINHFQHHRTKTGPGHNNWEGISAGAERDMFEGCQGFWLRGH